jgi:hypothetical protein
MNFNASLKTAGNGIRSVAIAGNSIPCPAQAPSRAAPLPSSRRAAAPSLLFFARNRLPSLSCSLRGTAAPPPVIARSEATWQSGIPCHVRRIATSRCSYQRRVGGRPDCRVAPLLANDGGRAPSRKGGEECLQVKEGIFSVRFAVFYRQCRFGSLRY